MERNTRLKDCFILGMRVALVCLLGLVVLATHAPQQPLVVWSKAETRLYFYSDDVKAKQDHSRSCKLKTRPYPISNSQEVSLGLRLPGVENAQTSSNEDLTVITAFINIGRFRKGMSKVYTPSLYRQWSELFSQLNNSVVAFFDNASDAELFRKVRSTLPERLTQIAVISRTDLWAFKRLGQVIADIYHDSDYPKYYPNTVLADYASTMHAKYEFVLRALSTKFSITKFYAWLDIGYFRDLQRLASLGGKKLFKLHVPPGMNVSCISYQQVNDPEQLSARDVFHGNKVWVGGGFFVGVAAVMATWAMEYLAYVSHFACQGLMNTDQQVIYAAFHGGVKQPLTCLQTHTAVSKFPSWVSLGYASID